jgi:hypothetical protein
MLHGHMDNLKYREFYRRNLPHIQLPGRTFLINFRLAGSLPQQVVEQIKAETDQVDTPGSKTTDPDQAWYKLLVKWDEALHKSQSGTF